MKFRLYNKHAKDYVRNSSDVIVVFDLITWAYYAAANCITNLDGYTVEQQTELTTQSGEAIFLPIKNG